jgi:hypothetical protein
LYRPLQFNGRNNGYFITLIPQTIKLAVEYAETLPKKYVVGNER